MQSIVQENDQTNADGLFCGYWDTDVQKSLINRGYDAFMCVFMCFLWCCMKVLSLKIREKSSCVPAERLFYSAVTDHLHDFRHALYLSKFCSQDLIMKYALFLLDLWLVHDLKNALTYKCVFINEHAMTSFIIMSYFII